MATQTQDDIIAALMSMGFELQDAQDALQYGKLSVQEAVEWLVAGKPGFAGGGSHAQAPVLKLGGGQGRGQSSLEPDNTQGPYFSPLSVQESMAHSAADSKPEPTSAVAEPSSSDCDMEQHVVSRLHLNEEKMASRQNFEKKELAEASRKAKMEKLQTKREHERIMKEIAEDRKINKMLRLHGPTATRADAAPSDSVRQSSGATSSGTAAKSSSGANSTQCLVQIRLPNGRQLRKKLERTMTLGQLWVQILDEIGHLADGHSGFMQPFPRREFTAVEMNKTLDQLGLVPTGSLVLKKEVAEVVTAQPAAADMEEGIESGNEEEEGAPEQAQGGDVDLADNLMDRFLRGDPVPAPEADLREVRNGRQHQWGRGQALEGPPLGENGNANGDENENGNGVDNDDDLPGFENFANQIDMFGEREGRPFFGIGMRLVPAGAPGADYANNRPAGDLAAEAAQLRLANGPAEPEPLEAPRSLPLVQVDSLQDLVMAVVVDRLTDPCHSMRTLGTMPENVSQKLLSCLMQRKLLDSKTLMPFLSCYLQRMILDTYTYTTNELLYALRLHYSLRTLSLHSCPLISDHGIKHLAALKNLKVLNLGVCKQVTDSSLKVITNLKKLATLSLEETGVSDRGIIWYFGTKPCLKHINLNRTAVSNAILPHLKNVQNLQFLFLEETKITNLAGVEDLPNLMTLNIAFTHVITDALICLVNHPSLVRINLTNTENIDGDTALRYLAGLKLRTLCLPDRHSVTNAGLAHITAFHLDTLDLTNYIHVDDDGMKHVGLITSLQTLMLSNTRVTDEGLFNLTCLLNLKTLCLDRTSISDVGIAIVKGFKQLSELSVSSTNVTNRFLKQGILHSCKGLTKLNLSRTQVSDTGVLNLKLPLLSMLNLDCTRVHAEVIDAIRANCPALKSITTANLAPVMEEEEEEED